MQDTELYRQILGLPAPWRVANVQLNVEEETVHLFVEYDAKTAVWKCPDCDKVCSVYDHRDPRQWRHLDSCQFLTYLATSLPRVQCPQHGVQTVSVSWSEPSSRFTHLFACFALDVLHATKIQPQTMTDKQKMTFAALSGLELETVKVWLFKENFRQFFACHTEYGARSFFLRWQEAAQVLNNPHFNKVAEMLHRHLDGLLAYVRHRVSNGIAEGLNGQIQLIKASARGFRQFDNFRVAILFFLGKLDVYPHKSP